MPFGSLNVKGLEIVADGWKIWVNYKGETLAVSSPEKPVDPPDGTTGVYLSVADYNRLMQQSEKS